MEQVRNNIILFLLFAVMSSVIVSGRNVTISGTKLFNDFEDVLSILNQLGQLSILFYST